MCEHKEQAEKGKIPFYTCWSALWHSWWVLHADLCVSAPWSVQCPPRLFVQTLWRHHHTHGEMTHEIKNICKRWGSCYLLQILHFHVILWLREQRLFMSGLKVRWHISVRSMPRNILSVNPQCWSYWHSLFFCFSAASPSWMFCSKAASLLSLCSWLSWPNNLLVIPFKEKTRTVCACERERHTHTHTQQFRHGLIVQENARWVPDCAVQGKGLWMVMSLPRKPYPSDQLFSLLLFVGQVLRRQLQLVLDQLVFPAHCPYGSHTRGEKGSDSPECTWC